MKRWIFNILIIVFLLVFLVSGFFLVRYLLESKKTADLYTDLASRVEQAQTTTVPTGSTAPTQPGEAAPETPRSLHPAVWIVGLLILAGGVVCFLVLRKRK